MAMMKEGWSFLKAVNNSILLIWHVFAWWNIRPIDVNKAWFNEAAITVEDAVH